MSEENTTVEAKLYELGYHLDPAISEDELSTKIDEIKKILANHNAEIIKEGQPKVTKLAYEIIKPVAGKNQKFTSSYFNWVKFNATVDDVEAIKEEIDAFTDIFRSLIIKTVDDDEHSTSKILDKEAEAKESEDDEKKATESEDKIDEKVEATEEKTEKEPESESAETTPTDEDQKESA